MNVKDVVTAGILSHLTDGFQERQAFDITHRAADFNQNDISF